MQITADIYPYLYWQSNLGVFYPKRNFTDSAETAFILAHLTAADDIIFNSVPGHPEYRGKTLAQIAMHAWQAGRADDDGPAGEPGGSGAGIVAKGMDDNDVATLMQWPFTNICSDGMSTGLHPRGFGSFPKVVGPYVRDRKLFSVEEAVRKMSSLAAKNVGLTQRGAIAPGYFADLVLFDPATVTDHASFETPQALATGIQLGVGERRNGVRRGQAHESISGSGVTTHATVGRNRGPLAARHRYPHNIGSGGCITPSTHTMGCSRSSFCSSGPSRST